MELKNEINKLINQYNNYKIIHQEKMKSYEQFAIENNIEIWKKVLGYENYEVSTKGNVRKGNKLMKTKLENNGYYRIGLYQNKMYKYFSIHRLVAVAFINNPQNKLCVDHINNNKIDNNVTNLRYVTHQENNMNVPILKNNTSSVKGVYFDKEMKKWRAQIMQNYKILHIGLFNNIEDAKLARQNKAKELFGEFINKCEL